MGRKGQAAMEYLMTYGWAILIIIVVIGALWKMGVFSTESTVTCSPCFSYFAFVDYASGTLIIRNGPQGINITSVTNGADSGGPLYDAGDEITVVNISTAATDVDLQIDYINVESGLSHSDTATIHN